MAKETVDVITALVVTGFLVPIGEKLAEKSTDLFNRVLNSVKTKILQKCDLSKEIDEDYLSEIKAIIVESIMNQSKKMGIDMTLDDLHSQINDISVNIGKELGSIKRKEDLMKTLRDTLRKSEEYLDEQQNPELGKLMTDAYARAVEIAESEFLEEIDRVGKILGANQKTITKKGVFIEAKRDVKIDRSTIVGRDFYSKQNQKKSKKTNKN